jgi:PPOX class probable FMN-dependent enzyme
MSTVPDLRALRDRIGEPREASLTKDRDRLDKYDRLFLSKSPFLSLGTTAADGHVDVSIRGDPPGFVRVLDDRTILIPERPGNRRADTMGNLMKNPAIGIVSFVPGVEETLRICGRGLVVDDSELLAPSAVRNRPPKVGIQVEIDRVFFHCGKALKRSDLWGGGYQIERSEFPSLAQILHDQKWGGDVDSIQAEIDESYQNRMY